MWPECCPGPRPPPCGGAPLPAAGLLLVLLVVLLALVLLALAGAALAAAPPAGRRRTGGGAAAPPSAAEADLREAGFPFLSDDLPPPGEMFAALRAAKPRVEKAKGYGGVVVRRLPADRDAADALSSHFTEAVRARCAFRGKPSPAAVWLDPAKRRKIEAAAAAMGRKGRGLSPGDARREALYAHTRWCNFYNPAFCLWVYRDLARRLKMAPPAISVLDPSAGWGDRALAAAAFGARYHGCDPNLDLLEGYAKMYEFLGGQPGAPTSRIHSVPFETEEVAPGAYDIVHTSPPFFDWEAYPGAGGAAARDHPDYADWLAAFYRPYLANAWKGLRAGGLMCLYLSGKRLEDDTHEIVEALGGVPAGRYGFQQEASYGGGKPQRGPIRPAYVWRKPDGPAAGGAPGGGPAPLPSTTAVVDTLNLAYTRVAKGGVATRMTTGLVRDTIAATAAALREKFPGRVYYVLKSPDSRPHSPEELALLWETAKEHKVSIHIAEVEPAAKGSRSLGSKGPRHEKKGRDDFYVGYLAWKLRAAVVTDDRMRDYRALKSEVPPFRVRRFDWWEPAAGPFPAATDVVNPGAAEYAKITPARRVPPAEVLPADLLLAEGGAATRAAASASPADRAGREANARWRDRIS